MATTMTNDLVRRSHAEVMALFEVQGVSSHRHYATVCPMCGTVQSMASLVNSGADPSTVERSFEFSCEGRLSGAGPWPNSEKKQAARRAAGPRGCDWTLGGLFSIHKAEVTTITDGGDERVSPMFDVATPEQAQALEAALFSGTVLGGRTICQPRQPPRPDC